MWLDLNMLKYKLYQHTQWPNACLVLTHYLKLIMPHIGHLKQSV